MFKEELSRVADRIDTVIRTEAFPDRIEPEFLRSAVRDYPQRGGKRLRPAILLWSCGLCGGNPEQAINAAAAVEIFHNWTLVHDDIIDDDDFRRGRPTTHAALRTLAGDKYGLTGESAAKFGRDFAILAGDLQQAWANRMLLRSVENGVAPELAVKLALRMQDFVNRELISGEALDVEFPFIGPEKLTAEQVNRMLYLKTGVLLRFCAETGAMIAMNTTDLARPELVALGEFAANAGIAFQYRDDWLGLYGDQAKFGKPIGSDLAEAKPTLLLINALAALPPTDRDELLGLLGRETYPEAVLERARTLIRNSGAEAWLLHEAEQRLAAARTRLSTLPDNSYRQLLAELLDYLAGRTV